MERIPDLFQDQNVFVTGGTGFMGKVLLEKLLRSCPDVGYVFMLIRPKKGKDPSERIMDITKEPLFDVLKREYPENLKKLVPVSGDCTELGLGLSPSDRQMLEEKVSIVFHSAASVRFDDTLKYATIINTRGTREVMLLARNMKNLKVLVYLSTCYSNCDRPMVEEVIYPPFMDWKKMIDVVENTDEHTHNILTPKLLGELPNTYVFSKQLAECVIKDVGENLPTVIVRPTVVVATANDPFPGWVDSLSGPVGLLMGGATGIVRVAYGCPDVKLDFIPVDTVIRLMFAAAWKKAISGNFTEPTVYNIASNNIKTIPLGAMVEMGIALSKEEPLSNILWIPRASMIRNRTWYFWNVIFFHLIPAVLVDGLFKLRGRKPILVKLHRKIYTASLNLAYFTTKMWEFKNNRMFWLSEQLHPNDYKDFSFDNIKDIDIKQFYRNAYYGARTYILKDSPERRPQARTNYKRMYWIDIIARGTVAMSFIWYMFQSGLLQNSLLSIFTSVSNYVTGYLSYNS